MPGLRRKRPTTPAAPKPTSRSHAPATARVRQETPDIPTSGSMGGRADQLRTVWRMTRESDPRMPLFVLGPALIVFLVLILVGVIIGHPVYFAILAVLISVMVGTAIFGRRATAQVYAQADGQIGAAAGMIQGMRGDWRLTPAVGFTRNQDLVHRVAGRCGVILIGEGPSVSAQRNLISDQKRRINRVAPEVATHELYVGDGDGQVPLRKVQSTIMKFPVTVKGKEIKDLEHRLKALGGTNVPIPKGPMPRNARMPRGQR